MLTEVHDDLLSHSHSASCSHSHSLHKESSRSCELDNDPFSRASLTSSHRIEHIENSRNNSAVFYYKFQCSQSYVPKRVNKAWRVARRKLAQKILASLPIENTSNKMVGQTAALPANSSLLRLCIQAKGKIAKPGGIGRVSRS